MNNMSALGNDVTRKFVSMYMDFSQVLNKRGDETNFGFTINKTNMGGMERNIWDVSCIEK